MDDAKQYDVDRNGFDVCLEQLRPPPGGNTIEQIAWIDALMVEAALMAFSMDTHRNNAMHTFNEHYKKLSGDNGDIEPEKNVEGVASTLRALLQGSAGMFHEPQEDV